MEKQNDKKELTDKQKRFCEEWLFEYNATKAYKTAYPDCKTDNAAAVNASRLLRNTKIIAYIDELKERVGELAGLSKLGVLNKLKNIIEEEEEATRDRIKALEVVNKMLSFNDPEKKDINVGGEGINLIFEPSTVKLPTNESEVDGK
jgi:phage terminase small subunit